jgi:starch-binding outer membrane protein, SusD/RagB family
MLVFNSKILTEMKTRNYFYWLIFACAAGLTSSCSKSFLTVQPRGLSLESNYYTSPASALAALTAAYYPLGWECGGSDNTYIDKLGPLNGGSDDCLEGGGSATDINQWQAMANYYMTGALGPQAGMWDRNYTGINNANLVIQFVGPATGLSTAEQTEYQAEAYFLRAYYYFDLIREFGNIPLITHNLTQSEIYSQVQASPDSVYAQIESDLTFAIANLPASPVVLGRVTKGAANALMGKVILTENNTARMSDAATFLEAVNGSGLYSLLTNYAEIFDPNNKFNSESIFEIVHSGSTAEGWGNWPNFVGNVYVNIIGPRSYTGPTYWSGGYGHNIVTTAMAAFMYGDPRYSASIANIDSLTKATNTSYSASYENTGYFINKFAPLQSSIAAEGQTELNFPNDYIEIRLADTYLMEAEALVRAGSAGVNGHTAQYYLDQVRARVGLASVPATLDNIYNERRMELAFEGHRWFDLVRTGQAATVLASKGFQQYPTDSFGGVKQYEAETKPRLPMIVSLDLNFTYRTEKNS